MGHIIRDLRRLDHSAATKARKANIFLRCLPHDAQNWARLDSVIPRREVSGTTIGGHELRIVLDFVRSGDVLMVTRIDRLARSIGDLQGIVRTVRASGVSFNATEQPLRRRSLVSTKAGQPRHGYAN
jgi:Resolvase, N terminal domain